MMLFEKAMLCYYSLVSIGSKMLLNHAIRKVDVIGRQRKRRAWKETSSCGRGEYYLLFLFHYLLLKYCFPISNIICSQYIYFSSILSFLEIKTKYSNSRPTKTLHMKITMHDKKIPEWQEIVSTLMNKGRKKILLAWWELGWTDWQLTDCLPFAGYNCYFEHARQSVVQMMVTMVM